MKDNRVVITGIGPFIHQGLGKDILWETVINNHFNARRIPVSFERNYSFNSKTALGLEYRYFNVANHYMMHNQSLGLALRQSF